MKFILLMLPLATLHAAITYPETKTDDVTDNYHGTDVADPYRWLEDDNSAETKAWVKAQNKVTESYLYTLPHRTEIRERLSKLWNYERMSQPRKYGDKYFFSHNSGLQNQSVLKVAASPNDDGKVLLDPNTLSKDGTVALANFSPCEDGTKLAYALSTGGSDWQEIRVRDVASGEDLSDKLEWVKFSGIAWKKDGSGFFYGRFDAPEAGAALTQKNENQKLFFHSVGSPQSEDNLIYERPDHPKWGLGGGVTEDGKFLIIQVTEGTDPKNRIFYKSLESVDSPVIELLKEADARYEFLDNEGSVFYFQTDLDAPRYRVIAIDTAKPAKENWQEIIPQSEDQLADVSTVGNQLICEYLQDAKSAVKCFDYQGKLIRDLELPGIGTAGGFGGKKKDTHTYFGFTWRIQVGSASVA